MTARAILRRLLLLPCEPPIFRASLKAFRIFGFLPRRITGEWPPRRILIVNLTGNLGDALMMLPTVDALHSALPNAAIDLITESPMDLPLRSAPAFRTVFCLEAQKSSIPVFRQYRRIFDMLQFARRSFIDQPYDLALLPRWGTDPGLSSYLAAMSSAPRRCGHDPAADFTAEDFLSGMGALLTDVSRGGAGMAEGVREQLVLVACGLKAVIDTEAEERRCVASVEAMGCAIDVDSLMRRLGVPISQPFVLLAPGASHPSRRWPPERYAELGMALYNRLQRPVFSIGSPTDQHIAERIAEISSGLVRSLAGKTSVLEGIALTRRASLMVTNDSGPAHIGGSVGVPTLVLSVCPITSTQEHANSPSRVRPVGPRVVIMQPAKSAPGCSDRCLREQAHCILGLNTDAVVEQAVSMALGQDYVLGGGLVMERSTRAGAPAATL